jgi:hypothetical protein
MYLKEYIYKTRFKFYLYALLVGLLLGSCERELDDNDDFTANVPVEVFGDNELLFSKIFRFQNNGDYLWFDIRNEIANFSSPFLGLTFKQDGVDRYKRIDLRGRLYEYQSENEELIILDYPLNILTGQDEVADVVFDLSRKEKDGCEFIVDAEQKLQCERSFVLTLKQISFKNQDLVAVVGTEVSHNNRTLLLSEFSQEIYLTN